MRIRLPQVTLIALTGKDFEAHQEVLDKSCEGIEFGAVKLIKRPDIKNIDDWNKAIVYDLGGYVDTEYAILIHADGYIINPDLWNPKWLEYDWCSSPWPLPNELDKVSYRSESGKIQRVGNSVGLRSKKLMDLIATKPEKEFWAIKEKYGNTNEDGWICCHNREWLESQGCKFMPFEEAIYFGKEAPLPENEGVDTFLFHKFG